MVNCLCTNACIVILGITAMTVPVQSLLNPLEMLDQEAYMLMYEC